MSKVPDKPTKPAFHKLIHTITALYSRNIKKLFHPKPRNFVISRQLFLQSTFSKTSIVSEGNSTSMLRASLHINYNPISPQIKALPL